MEGATAPRGLLYTGSHLAGVPGPRYLWGCHAPVGRSDCAWPRARQWKRTEVHVFWWMVGHSLCTPTGFPMFENLPSFSPSSLPWYLPRVPCAPSSHANSLPIRTFCPCELSAYANFLPMRTFCPCEHIFYGPSSCICKTIDGRPSSKVSARPRASTLFHSMPVSVPCSHPKSIRNDGRKSSGDSIGSSSSETRKRPTRPQ